nr:immunoglobulin light chain junction region [Macaca mulatta]
CQQYYIDPNSF